MYKIDPQGNKIEKLQECSFEELGFKERDNLQEWIAKEPTVLGEELLIIQKEFAGFSDTQERLDLLALDKGGSLVIIENKLDDTGRNVTWQALKYASYCSSLSKENIRRIYQDYLAQKNPEDKAEEKLSEFFDERDYEYLKLNNGMTQRIILIAAQFRKEVTSTVLWLLNFKIRLQCFRATPYSMGEERFLNVEQIIPTQDAEEYMIGMAEKARDDIDPRTASKKHPEGIEKEFWTKLIQLMNDRSDLYQNISPGAANWIGAGSGVPGLSLRFVVSQSFGRVELYIDRGDKEVNGSIFDELFTLKDHIEEAFGGSLVWERLNDKKACRIKSETPGNLLDKEQWDAMQTFMADSMLKLESALKNPLQEINQELGATVARRGT